MTSCATTASFWASGITWAVKPVPEISYDSGYGKSGIAATEGFSGVDGDANSAADLTIMEP